MATVAPLATNTRRSIRTSANLQVFMLTPEALDRGR